VNKNIPAEKNIEKLLKDLSADIKPYPKDLLGERRASYLSQVTSVVSNGPHLTKGGRSGQGVSSSATAPMTPLMKVVLTILIAANAALVTYLAISVYENWDIVKGLLIETPAVIETSSAPFEIPTQEPSLVVTPEFVPFPEETVVPAETPEPVNPSDSQPSDTTVPDNSQVDTSEPEASTPEPDGQDNSGKHLGQTPHAPDSPPGQNNQDNSQNDNQDSNQSNSQDTAPGNSQGNNNNQGNGQDNNPNKNP
jgi:hypothetical protein